MKTKLWQLALIISVVLVSCSEEDEDIGPQGPAGPQGATGPQGNANVFTTLLDSTSWINISNANYKSDFAAPAITQSIVDNGVVLVYMDEGAGVWRPLPYTTQGSGIGLQTYQFTYYLNGITFWFYRSDGFNGVPPTRLFKIVTIAGSVIRANPFVDYTNYSEVKSTFNIQN